MNAALTMPEGLDPNIAVSLLANTADLTLLLDPTGVIEKVALGKQDAELEACLDWRGRPWIETVSLDSRDKVEQMLRSPGRSGHPSWRHVNHPDRSGQGSDLPVLYTTMALPGMNRMIAVGREMRTTTELQQRLVDAQQSIERNYAGLRHLETRYRLLFQSVSQAVLIADAGQLRISELNPAAVSLLGPVGRRLMHRSLLEAFHPESHASVLGMLDHLRVQGRSDTLTVRSPEPDSQELRLHASLFRQEHGNALLLRLSPAASKGRRSSEPASQDALAESLLRVVERAPDGLVITDLDGQVLVANPAFMDMVQPDPTEPVLGQPISRWLGRSSVDFRVLSANLKQRGSVRLYATTLRSALGVQIEVEVSAVAVPEGEPPCLGFAVRDVGRRLNQDARGERVLPRTVGQLVDLVGRVPLKDIVAETSELIEQLCIEAALQLTRDNRASAAEMLSLSRQSLYVKLRRYGMVDGSPGLEGASSDGEDAPARRARRSK